MDDVNFASAFPTFESICCSIMEPLVKETAIMAATSLRLFMYSRANILATCCLDENFALKKVIDMSKKPDGEVVDDGKAGDDASSNGCGGSVAGENSDTFGHEGSDNGEGDDCDDDEDDDSSDPERSDGNGEEEEDDGYDEVGSEEEDDDEEYEEEEEEEGSDKAARSEDDMDHEPLLSHAQQFYAPDSFEIFKHEYKKSRALSLDVTGEGGSTEGLRISY